MVKVSRIRKRDDRIVGFDQTKITNAIFKALMAVERGDGPDKKAFTMGRL